MSTKVDTIDDFIQLAEEHGAEVQIREERETAEGFAYDTSGYTGGCGLPSCRCSPGLWVNAFDNDYAELSDTDIQLKGNIDSIREDLTEVRLHQLDQED